MIAEERRSAWSAEELEATILVFEDVVHRQIEAAQKAGELPHRLSPFAAHALMALLSGWAHKKTLLLGAVVGAEERDAFFDCAWGIFLNGVKASD
jgi:hypothetical protein